MTSQPLGLTDSGGAPRSTIAVLALPGSAGSIKDVRERHYTNGTRQEILLEGSPGTPGQNVIDVSVRTNASENSGGSFLSMGPPNERGIRNEILGRFPDVRMNIVTQPMSNRFGVFGIAIGKHRDGARCVFAWQWVDDLRSTARGISNLTKFGAMVGGRQLATSIRIRLCQKGATVDQLAGYIQGLEVMGRVPLQRLITMDRRNMVEQRTSAVSQSGINRSPLLSPVSGTLESTLGGRSNVTQPVKRVRKASRGSRRSATRRSPGNYNKIKHYGASARPAAEPEQNAAPPVVAPGSRYLAPVENASPPPSTSAAATFRPSGSAALPAEAYRGPGR